MRKTTSTVAGARTPVRPFTQARTSVGRIDAIERSPKNGRTWLRRWASTCATVLGRCTCAVCQLAAYSPKVIRPATGSRYEPSSSWLWTLTRNRSASTLRSKCRARCGPPGCRRYLARHLPLGRRSMLATPASLLTRSSRVDGTEGRPAGPPAEVVGLGRRGARREGYRRPVSASAARTFASIHASRSERR